MIWEKIPKMYIYYDPCDVVPIYKIRCTRCGFQQPEDCGYNYWNCPSAICNPAHKGTSKEFDDYIAKNTDLKRIIKHDLSNPPEAR